MNWLLAGLLGWWLIVWLAVMVHLAINGVINNYFKRKSELMREWESDEKSLC